MVQWPCVGGIKRPSQSKMSSGKTWSPNSWRDTEVPPPANVSNDKSDKRWPGASSEIPYLPLDGTTEGRRVRKRGWLFDFPGSCGVGLKLLNFCRDTLPGSQSSRLKLEPKWWIVGRLDLLDECGEWKERSWHCVSVLPSTFLFFYYLSFCEFFSFNRNFIVVNNTKIFRFTF